MVIYKKIKSEDLLAALQAQSDIFHPAGSSVIKDFDDYMVEDYIL